MAAQGKDLALHILYIVAGIFVTISGFMWMINGNTFQTIMLGIFQLFFGALVIMYEVKLPGVVYNGTSFYQTWLGRFFWLLFLGFWSLGTHDTFWLICGIIVLVTSGCSLVFHFVLPPPNGPMMAAGGGGSSKSSGGAIKTTKKKQTSVNV